MKKLIVVILLSSLAIPHLFAQDAEKKNGLKVGKGDKIVINIGTDMWQEEIDAINISGYSPTFDLYGMNNIPFGKSKFSFALGFGFGIHNMRSNAMPVQEKAFNPITLQNEETGKTIFSTIPNQVNGKDIEYMVNKFTFSYFDIPLEFRYSVENKKGKSIKLAAGGKIGYLMNNHTKYRGTDLADGEGDVKYKNFAIPNVDPLRYGVSARFSYGIVGVYGYYSLSKTFKKDKGPEMFPISLGISITPL